MPNKVVRGGGAGAVPAPVDPTPVKAAEAAPEYAVFKKGGPCKKCGGSGKVKYKDPRKVETVHTCQDCQPGM
jgi:hypothetical protein